MKTVWLYAFSDSGVQRHRDDLGVVASSAHVEEILLCSCLQDSCQLNPLVEQTGGGPSETYPIPISPE